MANYSEFYQYAASLASMSYGVHKEHIWEYAQMIQAAIPGIVEQVKEEVLHELELREKEKNNANKDASIKVQVDEKDIERQIREAIAKAFK